MALNEAKEKVRQLETAIQKLDLIKRHLSRNASDIKGEIHSCVSHNLECLRGREVSLLGRVDEVVGLKEESLQQQQAQLNQALGVLQTRMALMTNESVMDKQMTEILNKFNEIELSPGETPHIAFRADHMSLRECILNYGRVDANALPLPSAFDDPGKPSASLPRHLEEYEDVDHHVFHKTVEELQANNSVTRKITVTIPKLSTKMEDWLQKRLAPQEEIGQLPVRPMTLNSCGPKIPSQSCCSTPGDSSSLSNWLSQIKNHADLEEEHDFEIVDKSRERKGDLDGVGSNLEEIKQWLNNSPGYMENLLKTQKQSNDFFHQIPVDSKMWLHQACQQMSSLEEMKQNDFFHHISKETSTWLRSRAHVRQHSTVNETDKGKESQAAIKDKNICQWLAQSSQQKEKENGNNNCCRQDPWLQTPPTKMEGKSPAIPFQLEDICKANELCQTISDCVCNPNCASQCHEELFGVKNPKVFKFPQLPLSQWLLPSDDTVSYEKMDVCHSGFAEDEKKEFAENTENENLFSHIADLNSDQWLFKPPGPMESNSSSSSPAFKKIKEEANLWRKQAKEPSTTSDNPKMMLNFNSCSKSMSEWLVSYKQEHALKEEQEEVMKDESEGWSLCSSPASFNSDQYSTDVRVATNYLQNWIL